MRQLALKNSLGFSGYSLSFGTKGDIRKLLYITGNGLPFVRPLLICEKLDLTKGILTREGLSPYTTEIHTSGTLYSDSLLTLFRRYKGCFDHLYELAKTEGLTLYKTFLYEDLQAHRPYLFPDFDDLAGKIRSQEIRFQDYELLFSIPNCQKSVRTYFGSVISPENFFVLWNSINEIPNETPFKKFLVDELIAYKRKFQKGRKRK